MSNPPWRIGGGGVGIGFAGTPQGHPPRDAPPPPFRGMLSGPSQGGAGLSFNSSQAVYRNPPDASTLAARPYDYRGNQRSHPEEAPLPLYSHDGPAVEHPNQFDRPFVSSHEWSVPASPSHPPRQPVPWRTTPAPHDPLPTPASRFPWNDTGGKAGAQQRTDGLQAAQAAPHQGRFVGAQSNSTGVGSIKGEGVGSGHSTLQSLLNVLSSLPRVAPTPSPVIFPPRAPEPPPINRDSEEPRDLGSRWNVGAGSTVQGGHPHDTHGGPSVDIKKTARELLFTSRPVGREGEAVRQTSPTPAPPPAQSGNDSLEAGLRSLLMRLAQAEKREDRDSEERRWSRHRDGVESSHTGHSDRYPMKQGSYGARNLDDIWGDRGGGSHHNHERVSRFRSRSPPRPPSQRSISTRRREMSPSGGEVSSRHHRVSRFDEARPSRIRESVTKSDSPPSSATRQQQQPILIRTLPPPGSRRQDDLSRSPSRNQRRAFSPPNQLRSRERGGRWVAPRSHGDGSHEREGSGFRGGGGGKRRSTEMKRLLNERQRKRARTASPTEAPAEASVASKPNQRAWMDGKTFLDLYREDNEGALFPADIDCSNGLTSAGSSDAESTPSSRPPPPWAAACEAMTVAAASVIQAHLSQANKAAKFIDKAIPCVLLTNLPNMSSTPLQRMLSQYLRSLKIPKGRIYLAIFPDTGLCRGWGVIEPTSLPNLHQLLNAPAFQWRGMLTTTRPLSCPHLLQLNGFLGISAQHCRPSAVPDVAGWSIKDFGNFNAAFRDALLPPSPEPGTQTSPLGSTNLLVMSSSARRLHFWIPLVWPSLRSILEVPLAKFRQQQSLWMLHSMSLAAGQMASPLPAPESQTPAPQSASNQSNDENSEEPPPDAPLDGNPASKNAPCVEPHHSVGTEAAGELTLEVGGEAKGDGDMDVSDDEKESTTKVVIGTPDNPTSNDPASDPTSKPSPTSTPDPIESENACKKQETPSATVPPMMSPSVWKPSDLASLLSSSSVTTPAPLSKETLAAKTRVECIAPLEINKESVCFKFNPKESELGSLSLFSAGGYPLLAVQLLLHFIHSLLSSVDPEHKILGAGYFLHGLQREGVCISRPLEALLTLENENLFYDLSLVGVTTPAPTEDLRVVACPEVLLLSDLPNSADPQLPNEINQLIEKAFEQSDNPTPAPPSTWRAAAWGAQCWRFAETNRWRGDGLLLLTPDLASRLNKVAFGSSESATRYSLTGSSHGPFTIQKCLMLEKIVDLELRLLCVAFNKINDLLVAGVGSLQGGVTTDVDENFWLEAADVLKEIPSLRPRALLRTSKGKEGSEESHLPPPVHLINASRHDVVIEATHLIETHFYSIIGFFSTPVLQSFLDVEVKEESTGGGEREPPKVRRRVISEAERRRWKGLANHDLPDLTIAPEERAVQVHEEALKVLGAAVEGDDVSGVASSLDYENKETQDAVAKVFEMLNQYIQKALLSAPETSDSRPPSSAPKDCHPVQWLIFENPPNWQATLRVPAVTCVPESAVDDLSPPTDTGSTHPFELTGDISNSTAEAKLSCALAFLSYMTDLETKMLQKLGISKEEAKGLLFEISKEKGGEGKESALPVIPSRWEKAQSSRATEGCSIRLKRFDERAVWTVNLLKELQTQGHFRYVPLEFVLETPRRRFELDTFVQKRARSRERSSRPSGIVEFVFAPLEEDHISALIENERNRSASSEQATVATLSSPEALN